MVHAFLSVVIGSLLLISVTNGVCVKNHSCRAIHAEVFERAEDEKCKGWFGTNPCFSKRVNVDSMECCDHKNPDCWGGKSADDALYWINCDTDKRTSKGFGQTVVACSFCSIDVYDNGMIVVTYEGEPKKTRGVYSCKY